MFAIYQWGVETFWEQLQDFCKEQGSQFTNEELKHDLFIWLELKLNEVRNLPMRSWNMGNFCRILRIHLSSQFTNEELKRKSNQALLSREAPVRNLPMRSWNFFTMMLSFCL